MANIRIDNASDDMLKLELDGEKYNVPEDESLTISQVEKGIHTLTVRCVQRAEIESGNRDDGDDKLFEKISREEKSQYIRLASSFEVDVDSSKSVWKIKKRPLLIEKTGVDALFSGCELEVSGGRTVSTKQTFANESVRKGFLKKQLIGAIFPIGIGILIFTALAVAALTANISGNPITLGGREFTYPWTIGLTAIDLGFVGYFTAMAVNIISTAKRYK